MMTILVDAEYDEIHSMDKENLNALSIYDAEKEIKRVKGYSPRNMISIFPINNTQNVVFRMFPIQKDGVHGLIHGIHRTKKFGSGPLYFLDKNFILIESHSTEFKFADYVKHFYKDILEIYKDNPACNDKGIMITTKQEVNHVNKIDHENLVLDSNNCDTDWCKILSKDLKIE